MGAQHPLSHHPRDAARPLAGTRDPTLEVATCRRTVVARPDIGPGAAPAVALACGGALPSVRVRRHLEIPIIPAKSINPIFDRASARHHHSAAANARHAAGVLGARRHGALEPAHSAGGDGGGIRETPGPAAPIPFATLGADCGIAGAHDECLVVLTWPVKPCLRVRSAETGKERQQRGGNEAPKQAPDGSRRDARIGAHEPLARNPAATKSCSHVNNA